MKHKYCYYTLSCIMTTNSFMYNENVCCHYTSSRAMRNAISCIREMFVVIIYLLI